ncbi:hypothetical protein WA026_000235 [Henosepilachna vigintioctopunctata]|uniref:Uncharacterized protein n=1 Tax=Henosepilachna vigintioctopunctata TaxID=420089 RepID=A0AAW1UZS9_9CUCU
METRSECNKVRSMIELFENRSRKENAIRLNKPLSKSFSSLSHSEKKYRSNFYGNHDTIYKVEDKLASSTSGIKTYGIYSKETHIKHLQELLQILIALVNLDTGGSETIVAKKKEIVTCIVTRFEELNRKLPSTLSNENFDFTYKTYSSLISPDFQDRKNEDTESIVPVVGSAVGSIERLESSSRNSSNDNDRKSPDIIVENGTILGSVEKLKAIFSSNTTLRKQQVTENYSRKPRVDNGLNTYDSVAKNTVFENYKTEEKVSLTTVVTESTETELADEYEGSLVTDDSSSHKTFDRGSYKNETLQDQTEEFEKEEVEETSDSEDVCLSSKSLNEMSRNRDGMETVSSLKKIFENKDAQNTLDNQKSTEDEVVVPESLVVHVELLDNSEISITLDKDRVDVSHSEVEVLGDAEEALEDTLIELGGGDEEECNVTVLREHPEDDSGDTSSTKSDNDACIIS